MQLVAILAVCFVMLFVVEVFLGGALPSQDPNSPSFHERLRMGEFFGQLLPLSVAGIALPMSIQHHWAIWLVLGAALLHVLVCRIMRAC